METLEGRQLLTGMPYGALEPDLGEFLLGSVAVTPVFIESVGASSTEDWTEAHKNEVLSKIDEGNQWWVDTLATKSAIHELSFTVDTTYATTPVESVYEPISRRSNDYVLYVTDFLTSVGHNTGNLQQDMRSFNHAQRVKHGTDWAFTMIVVPSVNDADGEFAPGGSFRRAFAFAGGLFMVVPSTRPASTFTHETGHIFWARDEYPGGGSYFQRRGYYNTQNLNAHDNPTPGFVQQPSIMAAGTLLQNAYNNNTSPDSTLAMVGWQDSDSDGIFDVLDVPHRLQGTGYLDSGTYRFVGSAKVQTLPNLNPAGVRNDITINRIREIEYRFDGGPWQVHTTPDAYEVNLDLSINVPANASEIEIRARDSKTTVTSNIFSGRLSRADSTQVPGINGFVWIDQNRNDLRDAGEYGQALWTVELVDSSGDPLQLEETVEPDDYASGQLTSGFHPDVVLSSVGTDADGRIGVFNDSVTSTGAKNFWGYSKSSQSYSSLWGTTGRRLQANFNTSTTKVSIDAVGSSNQSYGRLEAYNTAGQLLGRYTTGVLTPGQVETMTIERGAADIAYIIASAHASTSIRLDRLQFGADAVTTTGTQGSYQFSSLPNGNYNVRVTPPSGFVADDPSSGVQSVSVTANTATTDVDFAFRPTTSTWQNQPQVHDVNNDGFVSAIDVLLIVNEINLNGSRNLGASGFVPPPYIDSSGDGFVSALDVLLVVNYINQNGAGEGELASAAFGTADQFNPTRDTDAHRDGGVRQQLNSDSVFSLTSAAADDPEPSGEGHGATPTIKISVGPVRRSSHDAFFGLLDDDDTTLWNLG